MVTAKWNPGAKNRGPNFNPYRDRILVVEIFLIFFCVSSAVFRKPVSSLSPKMQRVWVEYTLQWQAVARVNIPNLLL